MDLLKELCFVFLGTFLYSILLYECRKLDGYEFPVYSTEFCPRNETEWNERSSAISCNESNGYMCLPNRELTQLLEFCYITPFLWMQEEKCFYLNKQYSRVNDYNCHHFKYGCPTYRYMSSESFKYQSCFAIGNGCFTAELSCNSTSSPFKTTKYENEGSSKNSTTSPSNIKEIYDTEDVTINFKYNKTKYAEEFKEHKVYGNDSVNKNKDSNNKDWTTPVVVISLGTIIPCCVIGILSAFYKKGQASNKRRSCVEVNKNVELTPFIERQTETEAMESGTSTDSTQGYANNKSVEGNEFDERTQFVKRQDVIEAMEIVADPDSVNDSRNDQDIFDYWQESNDIFVPTKACDEVENCLKNQNIVIVVGHSGSGKSAIIHHIALKYRNQGWTVKPVTEVTDILTAERSNKTLFVLNDPIGKESFDEVAYAPWKKNEERLQACLRKIKILLSCRKCVQCDKRAKGLFKENSNIVVIDADKCKLSKNEKRQIINKYNSDHSFSDTELTEILKIEVYFPLLCKLYFSDKKERQNGVRFFREPIQVLEEEIRAFRESSKEKYCALVLLVIFNNDLCVSNLLKDKNSRGKFKYALQLCGMNQNTPPYSFHDILDTLKGFFITKIGNAYHFCHDLVMEVTTFVFGSDYPADIITYAGLGFLRKRVKLEGCCDKKDELTIYLNDEHVSSLGERLFWNISEEHLLDVVLNPCLKNEKVVQVLIEKLQHHSEKINLLFNKEFQFKKHELYQASEETSKDLLFSTLDFVGLKRKISPLFALIAFGHTTFSLYCLKVLMKSPNGFKDDSLFYAVCCNGAIELYEFYQEEIVKYMSKKWVSLYPVHILSAFHNHEILYQLIQYGVDVNVKSVSGWTALTLAAGNNTEESEEQKEENLSNTRRNETLQLLLSHGANINLCSENGVSPLFIACQQGNDNLKTVQLLLNNGADINLSNYDGATPLLVASENGHESIVQLLLSKGSAINSCTKSGASPLYFACRNGHYSTVQLLLREKADIDLCLENGTSPLHKASENGHDSIVELLLNSEAAIDLCTKSGASPIYLACRNGHYSTVQLLLSKKADINLCLENGISPLHKASENGHDGIVQLLLNSGAAINLCTKRGVSPLYKACQQEHESTVQLLLCNGADVDLLTDNGSSPLHIACQQGHCSTVQLLLSYGANINLRSKNGVCPLFIACQQGNDNLKTVQLLLNNGACINLFNYDGASPLFIASEKGHNSIAELLLNNGAEINSCTRRGSSPLYMACQQGHISTVQLLLSNEADINLCNHYGATPLIIASEKGHDSIVQLLLNKGAAINQCTKGGGSPLYFACLNGNYSTVQLLLGRKADINLCLENGACPLHIASENGHDRIVQLLLFNGSAINSCTKSGASPLYFACRNGHYSTVQLLLREKADINLCLENGTSPLHKAREKGHDSIVNVLLSNGAAINLCTKRGVSPIYMA